jgi:7-keto-8-aminopelargonate synthetase-like enzyme
MMGDIACLEEISAVCKRYNARLLVDDAHGIGVMGNGHGTSAHLGQTDAVDLIMGTFSKSFASIGGFIAGSADVIHYIQHHARSVIFSAALPAPNAATVLAALDIMETEPERVEKLWDNAEYMRTQFKALGLNTGNSQTPIIPIIIGEQYQTIFAWNALIQQGVYTNPVIPPAAPLNMSLLRTSYTATHTREHLDLAIAGFRTVATEQLDSLPKPAPENQFPLG